MLLYCLKLIKSTESTNSKVARTKNGRTIILSKPAVCGSKITLSGPLLYYRY